MTDYVNTFGAATKDSTNAIIAASDIGTELDNLATAVGTKADKSVPASIGNIAILTSSGNLSDGGQGMPTGTIVGTSDTQTLTNKTLTQPTITLKQGAAPAPTAEGDIQWDTDDNKLVVGDGAATKTISPDDVTATLTNKTIGTGCSVTGDLTISGATITPTELSYLDGVTSNIQTQINTVNSTSNILALTAAASAGGVGTYVWAVASTSDVAFGATIAGSALTPTSAAHSVNVTTATTTLTATFTAGAALSGTWRAMGAYDYIATGSDAFGSITIYGATLWLRTA